MVGSPPGTTVLFKTVLAVTPVTPAAAPSCAADIATIVEGTKALALLFNTHRLPLASKAIPKGPLKACATGGAMLVSTAAGVNPTPAAEDNCPVLNLKIALPAESLTHRSPAASKAANCGNLKVTAPPKVAITKFGGGFEVVLRLMTWLNRNL